jgi:hypothetical protein
MPRACAPYRARPKGKDERGSDYVKKNVIAGRRFEGLAAFEAHLDQWVRDVADQREHGTTGVTPGVPRRLVRFARWPAARRSDNCATWCAKFRPTARSTRHE